MSVEFDVQAALHTKLLANSTLTALTSNVYDWALNDASYPYVEVGEIYFLEMDTKGDRGFDFLLRAHTRSQSASNKECKDIQGAIYGALHLETLTIPGYASILLRRESSDMLRAPDESFHGICEYRGLIEQE